MSCENCEAMRRELAKAKEENSAQQEQLIHAGYKEGLEEAARVVDHILKEGDGTYGEAIRRLEE